jgi:hypothetical protein
MYNLIGSMNVQTVLVLVIGDCMKGTAEIIQKPFVVSTSIC